MAIQHQVVRVIVNAGHGLSNATPNVYDQGASSPFGTEAYIVSRVADAVVDSYYLAHDETCHSPKSISVIPTPLCSVACATTHKRTSHLAYVIDWINENKIHSKAAGYGDVVLSLHCNEAKDPEWGGTLVVIDNKAPAERYHEAMEIARIVSSVLGIPNRGVLLDSKTPRKSIGIVEDTDPPAYLIELGFVTNSADVKAIETCGAEAIIAVIERFAKGNK